MAQERDWLAGFVAAHAISIIGQIFLKYSNPGPIPPCGFLDI